MKVWQRVSTTVCTGCWAGTLTRFSEFRWFPNDSMNSFLVRDLDSYRLLVLYISSTTRGVYSSMSLLCTSVDFDIRVDTCTRRGP